MRVGCPLTQKVLSSLLLSINFSLDGLELKSEGSLTRLKSVLPQSSLRRVGGALRPLPGSTSGRESQFG
jgi:hypothetical protein